MFKGAVFDLDGTLLDSMSVWDTIGEDYLISLKIEPKENLNKVFKAMSMREAALYYIENYDVKLSCEEIMKDVNKMIESFYLHDVKLKPHAKELLEALSKKQIKMCIATAGDEALMGKVLERLGVSGYFGKILTCESLSCNKNQAMIYEEALKHLGTKKDETIVFEDAFHAIKAAKSGGFITAAVYDSHEEKQNEIKELSDYYFEDFFEAIKIF